MKGHSWKGLAVLVVVALVSIGAGSSSKKQGLDYRASGFLATGDTLRFAKDGMTDYGTFIDGGAHAGSTRTVSYVYWAKVNNAAGTLQVFSDAAAGSLGLTRVRVTSYASSGEFGGERGGITHLVYTGTDSVQILATD